MQRVLVHLFRKNVFDHVIIDILSIHFHVLFFQVAFVAIRPRKLLLAKLTLNGNTLFVHIHVPREVTFLLKLLPTNFAFKRSLIRMCVEVHLQSVFA